MVSDVILLDKLKSIGAIVSLDFHLANLFTHRSRLTEDLARTRLAFLIAWLSVEVRAGHVCINLADLTQLSLEYRLGYEFSEQLWFDLAHPTKSDWLDLCEQVGFEMVSDGSVLSPFILNKERLYFQRMWQYEMQVADYFIRAKHTYTSHMVGQQLLDALFLTHLQSDIDWQKVAVATAMTRKVTIISGGPGTGKTTTISKILAIIVAVHQQQSPNKLRIIAAAPTGKAAARLTESLSNAIATLPISPLIKNDIPIEAVTLHRLLGAKIASNHYRYNKENKLNVDLLLIDEASMIDLPMMASVIAALPADARLILLGDKEQLSSVEAGAVFGDLCELLTHGYSTEHVAIINQLTGYCLESKQAQLSFVDNICLLQKSYRFDSQSGIGVLATLIKDGQSQDSINLLLAKRFNDIVYYDFTSNKAYSSIIEWCTNAYEHYLQLVKSNPENPHEILSVFSQFRLLCALREGPFGVQGLNEAIEHRLNQKGLVTIKKNDFWYTGKPVMILKNSFSLGLFNGDIGITLPDLADRNKLKVYFLMPNGEVKGFSPFRLPEHETTYAMTIHKSQGSEFNHVAIILPTEYSPLLTRSLLYTAVTRAKADVTIFASQLILKKTITSQIHRQSGLVDLLA